MLKLYVVVNQIFYVGNTNVNIHIFLVFRRPS